MIVDSVERYKEFKFEGIRIGSNEMGLGALKPLDGKSSDILEPENIVVPKDLLD